MVFTGFFKTESNPGAKTNGWSWAETSINCALEKVTRTTMMDSIKYTRTCEDGSIYWHDDAAAEPASDGSISFGTFSGPEVEYTGGLGSYVKSFTSGSDFFTEDQNFIFSPNIWTIHYNAKVAGVTMGFVGVIDFEFYRRDSTGSDFLLMQREVQGIGTIYNVVGLSTNIIPTGSVASGDRLRVRVKMGQRIPS